MAEKRAVPAAAKAIIDEAVTELQETEQRLKLVIYTVHATLALPDDWRYDVQSGAFVGPDEETPPG